MPFLVGQAPSRRNEHARFAEIEVDLGIAGFEKPVWDIFVETFEDIADRLGLSVPTAALSSGDRAPTLQDALQARATRLAEERKAVRDLIEITRILYRSLTPRQRGRADRLLLPLFTRAGLECRSAE